MKGFGRKLVTIPAGKYAKFFVLGVWLIVFVLLFSAAGRFEKAQRNESASFLPGNAESFAALELEKKLPGGEQIPGLIVYHREGGLTAIDIEAIHSDLANLQAHPIKSQVGVPVLTCFAEEKVPSGRPLPKCDNDATTAILTVVKQATGNTEDLAADAKQLRGLTKSYPAGLQVKLTGAIGLADDSVRIFNSIGISVLLGALGIVVLLLLLIYRSPLLWLFPIISVVFAETSARGLATLLADSGITINGQSATIMTVLVFGVGTDYALLLVARYREELRRHQDTHEAMAFALRRSGPTVLASAATVSAALLSMVLADTNSTQSAGLIGAMGVLLAMLAMLTLLPALLLIVGRVAFWPFVPRFHGVDHFAASGFWSGLSDRIAIRPRAIWLGMIVLMAVMTLGWSSYSEGLTQSDAYLNEVDSVVGLTLLKKAVPPGSSAPTVLLVRGGADPQKVVRLALASEGIASARVTLASKQLSRIEVVLKNDPWSGSARKSVAALRTNLHRSFGDKVVTGGQTAIDFDVRRASRRDNKVIIPVALAIVFLILIILLRALVIPILLMLTVIASYFASLGFSLWVFDHVFGFPGVDPTLPLWIFIFLVALGIDYNIFLMARVREETIKAGAHAGFSRGLVATGGVITSAGIVLAGTFAVLGSLPLIYLAEVGFAVAFGVLFDALLVRSVLVPALGFDFGRFIWWPSSLAKREVDSVHTLAPAPES